MFIGKDEESRLANDKLSEIIDDIRLLYKELKRQGEVSVHDIRNAYVKQFEKRTLLQAYSDHLVKVKRNLGQPGFGLGTLKCHTSMDGNLKKFLKHIKTTDIELMHLRPTFANKFVDFMRGTRKYTQNYIVRNLNHCQCNGCLFSFYRGKNRNGLLCKITGSITPSKSGSAGCDAQAAAGNCRRETQFFLRRKLKKFRYGMGVFKVDWALSEPIPFTNKDCRKAGTVHLGNTLEEIEYSEKITSERKISGKPFVLLAQPSLFDSTRAPEGKHTAWAYCHVPNGSQADRTEAIEIQVERFAPGFKDIILERRTMDTTQMQAYNPNYIGGDINGGVQDIWQLYSRPVLSRSPYRTSVKGLYICSSSTPPGGGVHGMCGYHAARRVLKDVFI